MEKKINEKRIAVLVDNGFEQIELTGPVKALKDAGAKVSIVSKEKKVKGWNSKEWGDEFTADVILDSADPASFDALLLPGGVMNPDKLRMNKKAVEFVKSFIENKKPVAAICHGPWTLIETGLIKGKKMTSWPSLKTDLVNAGAEWSDQQVVVDNGLVTSRKPDDIPAFNEKMVEEFSKGASASREKTSNPNRGPVSNPVSDKGKKTGRLNENIDAENFGESGIE
jgi:protease I